MPTTDIASYNGSLTIAQDRGLDRIVEIIRGEDEKRGNDRLAELIRRYARYD